MKIRIIVVGKIKNPAFVKLERDFLTQLKKYARMEIIHIKDESVSDERREYAKKEEGKRILKTIKNESNEIVIALDEKGGQMSSIGFSEFLTRRKDLGENITFIIGGPFGLAKEVLKKADKKLALSEMTFLHEMAYAILLEQIFRGFSIAANSSYHK